MTHPSLTALTARVRRRATVTLYWLNAAEWLAHWQQAAQTHTERLRCRRELWRVQIQQQRIKIATARFQLATCWRNAERRRLEKVIHG